MKHFVFWQTCFYVECKCGLPAFFNEEENLELSQNLYSVDDVQRLAKVKLPKMIYDFVEGSAGDESLRDLNTAALDKMRLMPRVLIDVSKRSLDPSNFLAKIMACPLGSRQWVCVTWYGHWRIKSLLVRLLVGVFLSQFQRHLLPHLRG